MSFHKPIRLSDLPKFIEPGPSGKQRSISTVYRYALRGKYGVRLQVDQLPDGLYTTLAKWRRFIRRLTAARTRHQPMPRNSSSRRRTGPQPTVEAAIEQLRFELGKKSSSG